MTPILLSVIILTTGIVCAVVGVSNSLDRIAEALEKKKETT